MACCIFFTENTASLVRLPLLFSQKVLRLFGRPVPAAHFYFSAFMACRIFFTENTAALVRLPLLFPKKSCDFSGGLCLRRIFILAPLWLAAFSLQKTRLRLSGCRSFFPKKSCDFLGALRLRRVFILAPLGLPLHRDGLRDLPIFVCTKISHRCVVPPLSQKVLRLFGSPAHGLYKSHCALILMRLLFRKKSRSACLFACECAHDDKPSTKFCERAAGAIRENVTYQKGNCDGSYL